MRDKKLQIFVSSTYTDLKEERQAAVEAILKAGHIPAGMELFSAGDQSQMSIIKRWIEESDVYMLILGGRYGSLDSETGKSYTQLEFEYAIELGKPYFSLVLHDDFVESKVKIGGSSIIERDHNSAFNTFKKTVTDRIVEFCYDTKDIKLAVINKLSELSYNRNLTGWIRGDQGVNSAVLAEEIARITKENSELRNALQNRSAIEPLYNGLTYSELKSMLVMEKVTDVETINNLFELFILVEPAGQLLRELPFYDPHNTGNIRSNLLRLSKFGILNLEKINGHTQISCTQEGHKFYLMSLKNQRLNNIVNN